MDKPQKKNAAAVALGRRGGRIGGPARAASMTAEERSESARKAVVARWARYKATHGKSKAAMSLPILVDGTPRPAYEEPTSEVSFVKNHESTPSFARGETTMNQIEINYKAKSNVADSSCGVCTNFNPDENSETDGSCFGHKVVAEGLCDFYNPATSVVAIQGMGRLQESV